MRLFGTTDRKLLDQYRRYHLANPRIYNLFVKFARELKAAGFRKGSGWWIINRIRWEVMIETQGSAWKISNDLVAIYTRQVIWNHTEEFEDFFTIKKMKENRKIWKALSERDSAEKNQQEGLEA